MAETEDESLTYEQRKTQDRARPLSSSVHLSAERNKTAEMKYVYIGLEYKRKDVKGKKKCVGKPNLFLVPSFCSIFSPKTFDWKEDLFCIIPHRSACNLLSSFLQTLSVIPSVCLPRPLCPNVFFRLQGFPSSHRSTFIHFSYFPPPLASPRENTPSCQTSIVTPKTSICKGYVACVPNL